MAAKLVMDMKSVNSLLTQMLGLLVYLPISFKWSLQRSAALRPVVPEVSASQMRVSAMSSTARITAHLTAPHRGDCQAVYRRRHQYRGHCSVAAPFSDPGGGVARPSPVAPAAPDPTVFTN